MHLLIHNFLKCPHIILWSETGVVLARVLFAKWPADDFTRFVWEFGICSGKGERGEERERRGKGGGDVEGVGFLFVEQQSNL